MLVKTDDGKQMNGLGPGLVVDELVNDMCCVLLFGPWVRVGFQKN